MRSLLERGSGGSISTMIPNSVRPMTGLNDSVSRFQAKDEVKSNFKPIALDKPRVVLHDDKNIVVDEAGGMGHRSSLERSDLIRICSQKKPFALTVLVDIALLAI